ncbi:hypothetical protein Ssi03_45970 [Sphaerisporangium siamense]|uniref:DUF6292 domain-containing protein n=1 Tax=Sphaerisporangium siamense TaxID=795645 RepID=A0A7W7D2Y4_9ACTN|nr:DUF6292 family protein [Sphaerisporangium siamense]MBB4699268.1 hypothetical protein [Sphaerisporangium siamense]GII86607.1 hypothetical protein Ssi03_45970 [Sphaerisporangium siamense]
MEHEPYIRAVAEALRAADVPVASWHGNPDDPRNGAIILHLDDTSETALVWDEERGWAHGTGRGDGRLNHLEWICDDVLPEPAEVVHAVRREEGHVRGYDLPWYRDSEDGDDFHERLAAYRPAGS